jgi:2-polyprenyl-3-methyl-5-hydroxy-6-metoxy-1,4-benzoquinol methylase
MVAKEDEAFVALFERTGEFAPGDRKYLAYRNFNLRAVERGHRVAAQVGEFVRLEGARVLDVGCGSGGLSIAFAQRGAQVSAIEPDATRRAWAEERIAGHDVIVELSDSVAERLNHADESVDVVLLDSVIEHVEDPQATLREVVRVLRPGGVVYITWPNKWSLPLILRDPHYQMLGVVLMPRWLGRLYVERVRKVERGYWVNRIPTRRWLARRLRELDVGLVSLEPEGLEKLTRPETMSGRYPLVRWLAITAAKLRASGLLAKVVIAQYPGPSAIGRKKRRHAPAAQPYSALEP